MTKFFVYIFLHKMYYTFILKLAVVKVRMQSEWDSFETFVLVGESSNLPEWLQLFYLIMQNDKSYKGKSDLPPCYHLLVPIST